MNRYKSWTGSGMYVHNPQGFLACWVEVPNTRCVMAGGSISRSCMCKCTSWSDATGGSRLGSQCNSLETTLWSRPGLESPTCAVSFFFFGFFRWLTAGKNRRVSGKVWIGLGSLYLAKLCNCWWWQEMVRRFSLDTIPSGKILIKFSSNLLKNFNCCTNGPSLQFDVHKQNNFQGTHLSWCSYKTMGIFSIF